MLTCALVLAGVFLAADDAAIIQQSFVSLGDTARLHAVFKSARGQARHGRGLVAPLRRGPAPRRKNFAMAIEWRNGGVRPFRLPKSAITFVNAGIGATGSDIGAHRVKEHLLSKKPDFVVVEYSVNDPNDPKSAETLEGVLRQILKQKNHPAVALLFMMDQAGHNAQEVHQPIGAHYGLPMASYRDGLWPEIQAGRLAWTDVEADAVHPNDQGHDYAAKFIIHLLQMAAETVPENGKHAKIAALPAPKTPKCV